MDVGGDAAAFEGRQGPGGGGGEIEQRQWLAAMRLAAVRGEFFESSGRLNLSAASRVLGKNRSSAQHAFKELQARVASELDDD